MKNIEKADYIKELQGKRIKECMKLCGLKGVDLAKKLNYTPQQISYVINGHRNLTADVAISMAKIFTECLNKTHTITVEMPYSELSVEEKEEYQEEYYNGNSWINVDYEDIDSIDYRYLLGEADYMTVWENFDPPTKQTTDYLFKEGIKALLHHNGYEIDIKHCPDITIKQLQPNSILNEYIKKSFYNSDNMNQIINISTGQTLELLPNDIYQLFQDFSKAIISIIERKFEVQAWNDILNAPIQEKSHADLKQTPDKELPFDDNVLPFD